MFRNLFAILLGLISLADPLFASLTLRCNNEQTLCEVRSTRLTVGDRVGVFSSENMLVAIGVVKEIKGTQRMIEIQKSWGDIFRSHRARRIEDQAAENPEQYFRVQKPVANELWGAALGLYQMGVGDGVVAYNVEGQYYRMWKDHIYLVGRINYLNGSGKASDNLKSVPVDVITVSTFGVTGGLTKIFMPYSLISFQVGSDIGFGMVDATFGGNASVAQVLNDRLRPGTGLMFRGQAEVVMQRDGIQPRVGIGFLRLQDSNSFGLFVGVSKAL